MIIRTLAPGLLVVSLLGFAPVVAQETPLISPPQNVSHAYRMSYPSVWSKTSASALGADLAFVLPVSEGDIFAENLNLVILPIESGTSLEKYSEDALAQIREQIADMAIVETSRCTLKGQPAFRAMFTGRMGTLRMKWMQVWTLKDNRAYVLTYSSEEAQFERELDAVESAIKTFEFR